MEEALKLAASIVTAFATVAAAFIIAVAGGLITAYYRRKRDHQDREAQWRDHAIELTKLDLERKLKQRAADGEEAADRRPLRPSILDFLANYRDLQELGRRTPKDLYLKIISDRISPTDDSNAAD